MDEKTEIRDRILHAASERIMHYGYAKTTMAEIAADCGMSAGNIYRFFESKADLAEAMARKHYTHQHSDMAQLSRRTDLSPDLRIKAMFFKRMRDNFAMFAENAKILDVAEVLKKERPIFMNEQLAQERVYIAAVLEEGARAGLFRDGDFGFIAEMMQAATVKFSIPQMFSQLTLPKLERELDGVIDLFLFGAYRNEAEPKAGLPAGAQIMEGAGILACGPDEAVAI
jgi:AcrR family transcriptional regulator